MQVAERIPDPPRSAPRESNAPHPPPDPMALKVDGVGTGSGMQMAALSIGGSGMVRRRRLPRSARGSRQETSQRRADRSTSRLIQAKEVNCEPGGRENCHRVFLRRCSVSPSPSGITGTYAMLKAAGATQRNAPGSTTGCLSACFSMKAVRSIALTTATAKLRWKVA